MRTRLIYTFLIFTSLSYAQGFGAIGQKKHPNVHALLVGVSDYDEIADLSYAHKDASLMHQFLVNSFPTQKSNFRLLQNSQATEYAIISEVSNLVKKAKENDLVLIYFSCHGDVVEDIIEDEQGYFLIQNASKTRVYSSGGAIKFELISKAVNKLAAMNKAEVWFITDACKSGKAIDALGAKNTLTALTTSFRNTTNFISCAPHELSFEDKNLTFGVFTYHLVKAFSGAAENDGKPTALTVDELNSYLKKTVREFTENKQTPRITASNEFADIYTPNPQLADLLSQSSVADISASKGVGDENKSPEILAFERQLEKENFYGNDVSAENLLLVAKKTKSLDYEIIRSLFIESLMARIQRNTNKYLESIEEVSEKDEFNLLCADLRVLKTQIEVDHPMHPIIDLRLRFFMGMEALRVTPASDLQAVEQELLNLQKLDPKAAFIPQGLSMLYLKKGDYEKAKIQIGICQKLVPSWRKPKYHLIRSEIIEGKLENARENLNKIEHLQKNEVDPGILQMRYNLHLANLEIAQADKLINSAQGNGLNSLQKTRMNAEVSSLRGWNKKAEKLYMTVLESSPQDIGTLKELVLLAQKNADTTASLRYLSKLIALEPQQLSWQMEQARLLKQPFLLSEDKKFSNLVDLLRYTESLLLDKKYKEALAITEKYSIRYDKQADFLFAQGKIHYLLNNQVASSLALRTAISQNPYHFESIQALTYLLIEQKKPIEADAVLKKALPLFQESAKFLVFAYRAYGFMKERNDQYALLEKALKIDSMELSALTALYQFHLTENNFEEAEREFQHVMKLGGNKSDENAFYSFYEKQVLKSLSEKRYKGLRAPLARMVQKDPMNFQFQFYKAWVEYMEMDYKASETTLSGLSKFVQTLGPSSQIEFYLLKGKVFLETDNAPAAEKAFRLANQNNAKPNYLGLSMALFDQGKEWQSYFAKDYQFSDMNEDASYRYDKMMKKMQK